MHNTSASLDRTGGATPAPGLSPFGVPTAVGWIIGRTQTNGKADYDAVHKFQAGLVATQPGRWGDKQHARQDQPRLGYEDATH